MQREFEDRVAGFITEHGLIRPGWRVLVAVSGGADSIALLYVLVALRERGLLDTELVCAHVNHQLRGQQADADQAFVQQQAAALGLGLVCKSVDVRGLAASAGLSIETAGRILRLDALTQMALQTCCRCIALGHQADDNAETVIHRLIRGCGFRGLAGIWPTRSPAGGLRLIRPLLCVSRRDITEYLRSKATSWREDATNLDLRITRNRIRHRLIPSLQAGCGTNLIDRLSGLALHTYRLYRDMVLPEVQHLAEGLIQTEGQTICVSIDGLRSARPLVQLELLRQALVVAGCRELDLTSRHYQGLLGFLSGHSRAIALPGGLCARMEGGHLWIGRPLPAAHGCDECLPVELTIPGCVQVGGVLIEARLIDPSGFTLPPTVRWSRIEYVDLAMIRPPIVLRRPLPGDRFVPLGLTVAKKVARFLIDAKVPQQLRRQVLIVADQEKIIWVYPIRISELVKVRPRTRQILVLDGTARIDRGT